MGGRALKHLGCIRYDKDEYVKASNQLISLLEENFHTNVEVTKSYFNKTSYGDIDLLMVRKDWMKTEIMKEKLLDLFEATHIKSHFSKIDKLEDFYINNSVITFPFNLLSMDPIQVDLIMVDQKEWDTFRAYYGWGEVGNLIGKIFHGFGLKYGSYGVKCIQYKGTLKLGEFIVTRDMKEAFSFIGLNYGQFCSGFKDEYEVFDYIMSSPYFNSEMFQWVNLNAVTKKRNTKRENYHKFLEYIEKAGNPIKFTFDYDKTVYWDKIESHFRGCNFYKRVAMIQQKEIQMSNFKEKWNGNMLIKKYKITDKVLGVFMGRFTYHIEKKYKTIFYQWILSNNSTTVNKEIDLFHNSTWEIIKV